MSDTSQRPWLKWYDNRRWRRRADLQKRLHPTCAFCEAKGIIAPAEVADHIELHKGDYQKFWFGKLQSLCIPCHNKSKQQLEHRGYTTDIGADGWPTDKRHPALVCK
jgi:5-methylcytosine-specific restriction enzyme A